MDFFYLDSTRRDAVYFECMGIGVLWGIASTILTKCDTTRTKRNVGYEIHAATSTIFLGLQYQAVILDLYSGGFSGEGAHAACKQLLCWIQAAH